MRGQHHHFRCDKHKVDGYEHEGKVAEFTCGICGRPAKAYWYKGAQFAKLPKPSSLISDYLETGAGVDWICCKSII